MKKIYKLSMLVKIFIHSKRLYVSMICLSILFSLPFVVFFISNTFVVFCNSEDEKIYGKFDNILYDGDLYTLDIKESNISSLDAYIEEMGEIEIGAEEGNYIIGYASEKARDMGNIHMIEGGFAKTSDEIVVCESTYYECFYENKIGDYIEIDNHNYKLTGIINDYSVAWNKMQDSDILYPNILTVKSGLENVLYKIILIDNRIDFPEIIYENNRNLIANNNVVINNSSGKYTAPLFVYFTCYIAIFVLAFFIISFIQIKDETIYETLNCLYCGGGKLKCFISLKNLLLLIFSIFLGLLVGRAFSFLFVKACDEKYGIKLAFSDASYPVTHIRFCIIVAGIIFFMYLFKTKNSNHEKGGHSKNRKTDRIGLIYMDYKNIILPALLIAMMMLCIVVFSLYLKLYISSKASVFGKMPIDYDYQFTTNLDNDDYSYVNYTGDINSVVNIPEDDYIYYIPSHKNIIPDDIVEKISDEQGVASVDTFYEANDIYMDISDNKLNNEYLTGFPADRILNEELKKGLNINGDYRICQFYGLPSKNLKKLQQYVKFGAIDIEKINRGDEVILVVPMYEKVEYNDGTWSTKFIEDKDYKGSTFQYRDDSYCVGDDVKIMQIQPKDKSLQGDVNLEILKKQTDVKYRNIKIGAIIYERVMWFEDASQPQTAYTFIGTKKTLRSLDIEPSYSRTQIYLNDEIGDKEFEPIIHKYQNILECFDYKNNIAELRDYRQFMLLLKGICSLMIVLSICIALTITTIEMYVAFLKKKKSNLLLRILGVPPSKFIKANLIQLMMICFGALLIATLGGQYIIQMIYGSLDIINEYLGVGFIILLFFAIILILALIKVIILTPVIRKYVKKCI